MASVTVIFGGQEQKNYQIDRRMVVGRDPACEIHVDNLGISRQHCAFSTRGEAFLVQDLGSSNGTYVNGRKITEHFLNDADEIVIGKYTLKFKNESQAQVPDRPEPSTPVPDTLNTYVMDGNKIQEQLSKMRAAQQAGLPPAAQGGSEAHAPAATAKDYANAANADAKPASNGGMKIALVLMGLLIFALIAVVVVLAIYMFTAKPPVPALPNPPSDPAKASVPAEGTKAEPPKPAEPQK